MKSWGARTAASSTIVREVSVVVLALSLGAVAVPSADAALLVDDAPAAQAKATAPALPTDTDQADIPTRDGITLSAVIVTPRGKPTSGSRWPMVILPGTFAGDSRNINLIAATLAKRGYVTVSYLERGFGASGGLIDAGGPKDVADVSDAMTWALANTMGDPDRVGVASISYGAGFAPIAAVKDKRIKAVAMISGWGDMWASRYPNNTSAYASNLALSVLSDREGQPAPEMRDFFANATNNVFTPAMRKLAAERSPVSYLPQMRSHAVPMYVSTSMNESVWPADQTISFYDAYPGIKHLDILPGDHATTELGTPIGIPGVTWLTSFDWLDTYVAGTSDVAKRLAPVRVAPRTPWGTTFIDSGLASHFDFESYATPAVRKTQRQYLTSSSSLFGLIGKTQLTAAPGTGGKKLRQGTNLLLNNGVPLVQGGFEIVFGSPTTVALPGIDQGVTGLWQGPSLKQGLKLRGSTRVHLDLTPSADQGSVFVYLLEQTPLGVSTYVVGHKPYSWFGAKPGARLPIDVTIPYNAYDVPARHRLIVGVSTGDVLYTDNNLKGSSVTVGPGSFVDLPLL